MLKIKTIQWLIITDSLTLRASHLALWCCSSLHWNEIAERCIMYMMWIDGGLWKTPQELTPAIWGGSHLEGIQSPKGAVVYCISTETLVKIQGNVGSAGMRQSECGLAHYIGIHTGVQGVGPAQRLSLPFVFHPPVLKPYLSSQIHNGEKEITTLYYKFHIVCHISLYLLWSYECYEWLKRLFISHVCGSVG